jgi:polyisoprenyl-phosphate glycosyltransferase
MPKTIVLCPLYQDEASFHIYAAALAKEAASRGIAELSLLVINDGTPELHLQTALPCTIIHLNRNIGHQKAIAIGLAYAAKHLSFDQLIITDSDGEDQPADVFRLLEAGQGGSTIVVASRASRQESRSFRFFYRLYKWLFSLLTGKKIAFGNFMFLPRAEVEKLVHYGEIWNHLAGAIIKSKLPYKSLQTHRGRRYAGESKMSFTALLLHGLGAIGVFIEVIASRMLLLSLSLIGFSILAILVILAIKLFTVRAIPGWATSALSSMLVVLLQSFLLSLFTIFLYLSFQGQRSFIPAHHFPDYIRFVEPTAHHD